MVPSIKQLKVLNPLFFGARYKGLRLFICQEQYGISSHPNQTMEIFVCGPRPKGRGRKKGGGGERDHRVPDSNFHLRGFYGDYDI